jgi:hypothetical protein
MIFLMKGSHKMATKRILVTIKGGKVKKGKNNGGWGGGERHCGDQNLFGHHTSMATERFLVATWAWRLKGFWLPHNHLIAVQ